ncbi:MAG TPA: CAP domain-containing protein [Candidatus Saccharibacteria bacterium]|nr:CAP domain-containing protein [Candidatus Saccharibacteria bacterium]
MATKRKYTSASKIQCKKDHGHLVCWISGSNMKKRTILDIWLLPSSKNRFHPYLLRARGLIAVALLLVGLQLIYNVKTTGQPKILGYATNVSAQKVVTNLNSLRESQGLKPLSVDQKLNTAASLKAEDMFTNNYWSHDSPAGIAPWNWFDQAGYKYQFAGENLAKDFTTSEGVTTAWMNSPPHKANVMGSNYENIGVAVVNGTIKGQATTLVVALFGAPKQEGLVAGVATGSITNAASMYSSEVFANPARIQALGNPYSVITLTILFSVLLVAALTHWHYVKLPRKVRKSWYQHHALYTGCLAVLAITYITFIFTAGSI